MKLARRSPCPIACTLDVLGDKWTLLVVRDLVLGRSHFKEFLASPEGIATNVLSERLRRLAAHGLIEQRPAEGPVGRPHYALTEKGKALAPILREMKRWGLAHVPGSEARLERR